GNCEASVGTDKLLPSADNIQRLGNAWNPRAASQTAFAVRAASVSVNSCLSPEEITELQSLPTEMARMDRFRLLASEAIFSNPQHYLENCCRRLWYMIWFDPTNPRSYLWHYRIGYLTILLCGSAGLIRRDRYRQYLPLILVATGLMGVHVLVIASA